MQQQAFKFIIYTLLLAVICGCLQLAFNQQLGPYMRLKSGFLLLGIFVAIIISIHLLLLRSAQDSGDGFVRTFMGATAIKLMTYIIVLLCFALFTHESKRALVIYFLFYYFMFTILEVGMLYSELQKNRKRAGEEVRK